MAIGSRRWAERRMRRSRASSGSGWRTGAKVRRNGSGAWRIILRLFYANPYALSSPSTIQNPKSQIQNRISLAMPELPEVEVLRRSLEPHLVGERIEKVEVRNPSLREPVDVSLLRKASRGRTVRELRRRSKYLLIDLDGGWT